MRFKSLLKYSVRFVYLQAILSFFTIWYFDNFLFLNANQKFEIYLNLVEDRNRFLNFIPLSWIKIDFLFVFSITLFLLVLYATKFYTYVNELDFSYQRKNIDDYFMLYLLWNSYLFTFLYIFRFTNLFRSNLIIYTFIIPLLLLVFRNSELLSSFLGRSSINENYISFNLDKFSNFRNLRIVAHRKELLSEVLTEQEISKVAPEIIDKVNKESNVNLIIIKLEDVNKLSKRFENYLIELNKKVLIISENELVFKSKFIYRLVKVDNSFIYYFNNDIQYGAKYIFKRLFDITISLFLIIILFPVFVSICLYVLKISGFPIMIKQNRVGLHGKKYLMYKFRTMEINAHIKKSELSSLNSKKGPLFKIKEDPRLLSGAKNLRKYSLDELPQLFNVLKGDMSLVGPRPLFDDDTQYFNKKYMRRLNVLPGMTGLLQINQRNADDFKIWYKYDLEYIENWSLYLDLKILVKTFFVLIKKQNLGI